MIKTCPLEFLLILHRFRSELRLEHLQDSVCESFLTTFVVLDHVHADSV